MTDPVFTPEQLIENAWPLYQVTRPVAVGAFYGQDPMTVSQGAMRIAEWLGDVVPKGVAVVDETVIKSLGDILVRHADGRFAAMDAGAEGTFLAFHGANALPTAAVPPGGGSFSPTGDLGGTADATVVETVLDGLTPLTTDDAADFAAASGLTTEVNRAESAENGLSARSLPAWQADHVYSVGDQVADEQVAYICTEAHTSSSSIDLAKFAKLGAGGSAPTGAVLSTTPWSLRDFWSVRDFGAMCDVQTVTDAVVTHTSTQITSVTGGWTADDVGKVFLLTGTDFQYASEITGYTDTHTIHIADAATADQTAVKCSWGTDDRMFVQAAEDALHARYVATGRMQVLLFPALSYCSPDYTDLVITYSFAAIHKRSGVTHYGYNRTGGIMVKPQPATVLTADAVVVSGGTTIAVACSHGFDPSLTPSLVQTYTPGTGPLEFGFTVVDATHLRVDPGGEGLSYSIPTGSFFAQFNGICCFATDGQIQGSGSDGASTDDWSVDGMVFDSSNGPFAGESAFSSPLTIGNANRVRIINCEFRFHLGKAVFITSSSDYRNSHIQIWNNLVHHGAGNPFSCDTGGDWYDVRDNTIRDMWEAAESFFMGNNASFMNHLYVGHNTIDKGGNIDFAGTDCLIEDNQFTVFPGASGPAILCHGGSHIRVKGGTYDMTGAAGTAAYGFQTQEAVADLDIDGATFIMQDANWLQGTDADSPRVTIRNVNVSVAEGGTGGGATWHKTPNLLIDNCVAVVPPTVGWAFPNCDGMTINGKERILSPQFDLPPVTSPYWTSTGLGLMATMMELWADDVPGVTSSLVPIWPDSSGNDLSPFQTVTDAQPEKVAGPNGHAAVRFDGASTFLYLQSRGEADPVTSLGGTMPGSFYAGETIFAIVKFAATGTYPVVLSRLLFVLRMHDTTLKPEASTFATTSTYGEALGADEWHILTARRGDDYTTLRVDGVQVAQTVDGSFDGSTSWPLGIGAKVAFPDLATSQFAECDIAYLQLLQVPLSNRDMRARELFLAGVFGITGDLITPPHFVVDHNYAVQGPIAVPSGDSNNLPGSFVTVGGMSNKKLMGMRAAIRAGTSATVTIMHNGSAVGDLTDIVVTDTATLTPVSTPIALADGDVLAPLVTAIDSDPRDISIDWQEGVYL